jgi:AhpD family alkylhydroperoxidase
MKAAGATACTDITGFGLFGHLMRMARQNKLAVEVWADALPAFDGALEALREGIIPGAVERNREFLGDALEVGPSVDESFAHLGCDAQTSGGLLIAIAPAQLARLQRALAERAVSAFVVGRFLGASDGRIVLTTSGREHNAGQNPADAGSRGYSNMNSSSTNSNEQHAGCCADIFAAKDAQPGSANDTQTAFGAFMRSVQTGGALSEKAKELILFSLVVHSRCHPCFDAHYARARELGFTQTELDEAAWCAIAMGGAPVKMFYQECLKRMPHLAGAKPV